MRSKKAKEKKPAEKKIGLGRILANNVYMLGVIHKIDRGIIPLQIFMRLLTTVTYFLGSTYLLRLALNAVSDGKSFYDIVWLVVLFVVLELSADLISNAHYFLYYEKRRFDVGKKINLDVFKKAQSVELACYENPEYYDKFVKALGETDNRAFAVLDCVTNIIGTVVNLGLCIGLVVSIHPIFLLFAILPLLTIPLKAKYQKETFNRDMEIRKIDRKKGYPHRVFFVADYAKELRLTGMRPYLLKYMKEASEICRRIHGKKGGLLTLIECLSMLVGTILPTVIATVYAVFRTVVQKVMGYGDCLVVLNTTSQISGTLLGSVDDFMQLQNNALYIDTLREFLEYEPKIKDGDLPLPVEGDLVLDRVSFQYDGASAYTIKNVSMSFGRNQKVAIVGSNGAGKSTLVKLLLRLYDAEGRITYGGVDIKDLKVDEYRDIFSSVMQDYHIFALSAAENVTLAGRTEGDGDKIIEALKSAGIYDKICENGGSIDSLMTREFDEKGIMLSGGEAQKLAISHVYSKQNKFVILDEPSSALDPIAEYKMYETMLAACENCGVIFISHRLSSAVLADVIYLMENGEIAECGTHAELMAKDGIYAAMFRRQAENYNDIQREEAEV